MRRLCALLLLAGWATVAVAQNREASDILSRIEAARPSDKELSIYRLDWVPNLAAAQKQARDEKRPLVVVAVRNEHGDTFTGHC